MYRASVATPDGKALQKAYGAHGLPNFVLIAATPASASSSPGPDVLERWVGYSTATSWLRQFDAALADPTPVADKERRHAAQPTAALCAALGRTRAAEGKLTDAVRFLEEAQRLNGSPNSGDATDLFGLQAYRFGIGEASLDDLKRAADTVLAIRPGVDRDRATVGAALAEIALEKKDASIVAPYVAPSSESAERLAGDDRAALLAQIRIADALLVRHDPEGAYRIKRESMPAGWETNADKLNEMAWFCFEQNVHLADGEALARKGVELSKDPVEKASILDTQAELANAQGNAATALALARQAAELDPDQSHYKTQVERFGKGPSPVSSPTSTPTAGGAAPAGGGRS
jgi:tetratricopeptide (TPR) repeat protein